MMSGDKEVSNKKVHLFLDFEFGWKFQRLLLEFLLALLEGLT